MLEIREIWKTFNPGTVNEKQARRGVGLALRDGDFCTVTGGNGAGKRTMLNAVAGTWTVDGGSISIGGVDVTHLPEYKREPHIGRVFQDPMLGTAPTMQILEKLALTLLMASLKKPKLLLLDEHSAALDPETAAKVLELSDRIAAESGLTTILGEGGSPGSISPVSPRRLLCAV